MNIERKTYRDPYSGVLVTQLTDYKGHSHHFYFTNPGWYENGRKLLFSSDRNNRTNLFGVELATGEIEQLTDLEPVPPPQFMRACKNPVRDEVYFWHGLKLMALDLVSRVTRVLFELEPGWCASMTDCSADGQNVFSSCREDVSAEIHTGLSRGYVRAKIWEAKPRSQIVRVAVDGSGAEVVFEENYWIGHVNTSPTRANMLTFCHEGPWDKVDNRIWALDVSNEKAWKIRPQSEGESVGHEYWYSDGIRIGYHGRTSEGQPMIGRIRFDNTERNECEVLGLTDYGHIFSHNEDVIVGDSGGVIRIWKREGEGYAAPRVLCRHDSAMHIQQTHPHPRISPDGQYVVFTSDRSGYGNVYTVPLTAFESLPPVDE